jgi:dienelactone hydrolase
MRTLGAVPSLQKLPQRHRSFCGHKSNAHSLSTRAMASSASLRGTLTVYKQDPSLVMFTSGPFEACGTVVFVGGLTDGPLGLRYIPALAHALATANPPWRLCQPTLSSSYLGFGVSDLAKDVQELDEVLEKILADATDERHAVCLLGHSTGCQDIVAYLKTGKHVTRIKRAVLQAPVSDREAMSAEHGDEVIAGARAMADGMCAAGARDALMPRTTPGVFGTPITAHRYASLAGFGTADDMFSSDLTHLELEEKLGHLKHKSSPPVLWVFSADDEYVPDDVKEKYEEFVSWIVDVTRGDGDGDVEVTDGTGDTKQPYGCRSTFISIAFANHALDGYGPLAKTTHPEGADPGGKFAEQFASEVIDFINT